MVLVPQLILLALVVFMCVCRCVEYSVDGVGTTVDPASPGGVHVCV